MTVEYPKTITTDVLIIGGGGAGLRASIEAKEHGVDTLLVSQSRVGYGSNTSISGGAFAAVLGASEGRLDHRDNYQHHLTDTIRWGGFLSDQNLVEIMTQEAEQQAHDLSRFGVRYTTVEDSPWIALSVDPGHEHTRMVYSQNALGIDFTFPLRQYALEQGVRFVEGILITKLLKVGDRVVGATGIDAGGQVFVFSASAVILASGGLGQVYLRTDNTAGSTGDGYALAYEAGAILKDMEFVQFYPTGLGSGTPDVLYECLLLDAGGKLLNNRGEDIIAKHELKDPALLTRDRVSLAIAKEIADGLGYEGMVMLDLSEVPPDRMDILQPVLTKAARRGERQCYVAPTAHFQMGGVEINEKAESSIAGLYAAGEICAGIHGANRLSGNALIELWVFGTIAGRGAARKARETQPTPVREDLIADELRRLQKTVSRPQGKTLKALHRSLKEIMWHQAGVIRDAGNLEEAIKQVANLREGRGGLSAGDGRGLQQALKLDNMLTVSEMICRAALSRTESRGAHYRQDYPEPDNNKWLCNVLLTREDDQMALSTKAVKLSRLSP